MAAQDDSSQLAMMTEALTVQERPSFIQLSDSYKKVGFVKVEINQDKADSDWDTWRFALIPDAADTTADEAGRDVLQDFTGEFYRPSFDKSFTQDQVHQFISDLHSGRSQVLSFVHRYGVKDTDEADEGPGSVNIRAAETDEVQTTVEALTSQGVSLDSILSIFLIRESREPVKFIKKHRRDFSWNMTGPGGTFESKDLGAERAIFGWKPNQKSYPDIKE
ncbi:hypothetical protein BD324DRAFT_650239 [Kockovaella imperatae]|uniref:Uncharacterized protein n=1 Tax=Kockovaella imperatae TaxID=4999 RepID=A0A1Y1UJK3_9TREE|nr:hypothetical protein BD324DRAFT_650239 [Kockovaella imperatae]ORX37684.1 hypothetical protein BD324DRAFT_650239 [Kockovaella imperatae]